MTIKKISLVSILMIFALVVSAQDFNAGIAFGYAHNSTGGNGPVLHLEPGYQLNETFRLGLRMEWSILEKQVEGLETFPDGGDWSFTLNGQHVIKRGNVGYLFGIGGGLFRRGAISHPVAGHEQINAHVHPGFYPRLGISYRKFMLIAEYNFIPVSEEEVFFTELTASELKRIEVENSYFSLKLGFLIGK